MTQCKGGCAVRGREGAGGNVAVVTCPYYGCKTMLTARLLPPLLVLIQSGTQPTPLDTAVLIRHIQGSRTVEGGHKQEKTSFILK